MTGALPSAIGAPRTRVSRDSLLDAHGPRRLRQPHDVLALFAADVSEHVLFADADSVDGLVHEAWYPARETLCDPEIIGPGKASDSTSGRLPRDASVEEKRSRTR